MKKDLSNLRFIKKGVKLNSRENFDEDLENLDEKSEGGGGKGPLCRKYLDTLDMEFFAYRAKESKNEHSGVMSVRLPDSLLNDISIMVETARTPYRTKSEFIRSAVFVLTNYWAHKYPKLGKRYTVQKGIEECEKAKRDNESMEKYARTFREALPAVLKMTDKEIDGIFRKHERIIKSIDDKNQQYQLFRQFESALLEHGVSSGSYFQVEEEE